MPGGLGPLELIHNTDREYECAARTCPLGWPYERCLPPDAPEWIRRASTPGRLDALLGMGEAPARVIAAGEASKADAALARYCWLTNNGWLPANDYKLSRQAKNRTHNYSSMRTGGATLSADGRSVPSSPITSG